MSIDPEVKAKWVAALRSGEYTQVRGEIGRCKHLCCIGVGGDIYGIPQASDDWGSFMVALLLGLTPTERNALFKMNDRDGKSFAEIADWIEANL